VSLDTETVVVARTKSCEWIVKDGIIPSTGRAVLRCSAEAEDGADFCPVHRAIASGATFPKTTRQRRDLNLDVLPWGPDDFQRPR
jgi:hypothetical protein